MNGYGNSVFLRTAWEVSEGGAPPSNTAAPLISGTQVVGNTLTTTTGTWIGSAPITYTYQWYRGATLITGATSNTYVLVQADAGNTSDITCKVTATNSKGTATATSNVMNLIYDLNAFNVIVAIQATGVTLTTTQKYASNQLVIDTKNYGVWSKIKALYPFVGGTAAAHKFNWKDPRDLDAAFRLRFFGGTIHTANGVQGNALNAYYNTYLNANSLPISSNASGVYIRTNVAESGVDFGAINTNAYDSAQFGSRNTSNQYVSRWYQSGNPLNATSNTDSRGFYQLTRRNSSEYITAKNTSKVIVSAPASSVITSMPFYGLAAYFVPTAADAFHGSKQIAFHYFADSSLSDTELDNLYTAVQAFQTTLGRNV